MILTTKNRSRTEVVASILEACKGSSNKTEIMFSTYLSFEQVNEFLDELTVKGFLAYDPYKRIYNLTLKGNKFLGLHAEQEKVA